MILEEIDTDGKTFFFSPEAPQKKELPKRNTIEDCARCHKT